jgi:hypothetical protein
VDLKWSWLSGEEVHAIRALGSGARPATGRSTTSSASPLRSPASALRLRIPAPLPRVRAPGAAPPAPGSGAGGAESERGTGGHRVVRGRVPRGLSRQRTHVPQGPYRSPPPPPCHQDPQPTAAPEGAGGASRTLVSIVRVVADRPRTNSGALTAPRNDHLRAPTQPALALGRGSRSGQPAPAPRAMTDRERVRLAPRPCLRQVPTRAPGVGTSLAPSAPRGYDWRPRPRQPPRGRGLTEHRARGGSSCGIGRHRARPARRTRARRRQAARGPRASALASPERGGRWAAASSPDQRRLHAAPSHAHPR